LKGVSKKGKRPSSREKVHQLEVNDTRNTRYQAEEKGEMSNRRGLENMASKGKHLPSVKNKMIMLKKPCNCEETEAVKEDE